MGRPLTAEQTARRLRRSVRTVRKWFRSGLIPGEKKGRIWYADADNLVSLPRTAEKIPTSGAGEG
jgi:predicted site-specific integrase-resolvase